MSKKKILVVDDLEILLLQVSQFLSKQYEVVTAQSGAEAIELYEKEKPDMVLSDLLMPGMSGFELVETLQEKYGQSVPVMFMTADDETETETKGLELGARDYIRKPVEPDILLQRVGNILSNVEHIQELKKVAQTDAMTGLLNKVTAQNKISELIDEGGQGILMVIDLDNFKPVNDIYGHRAGDQIILGLAEILRSVFRSTDILGRIGGDEFIAFFRNAREENVVAARARYINQKIVSCAGEILGENMSVPLGVSIGAVVCPEQGTDYEVLFSKADSCLYQAKQRGKHDYVFYHQRTEEDHEPVVMTAISDLRIVLGERSGGRGAFHVEKEMFQTVYRFCMRFLKNYIMDMWFVLFSLRVENEQGMERLEPAADCFCEVAASVLRSSDVIATNGSNQVILLLMNADEKNCCIPIERIMTAWRREPISKDFQVDFSLEHMENTSF